MKYLEKYENIVNITPSLSKLAKNINVKEAINKYGEKDTAILLYTLLNDKYVNIENGIISYKKTKNDKNLKEGKVENIFFISTSGFLILRFKKTFQDVIINNATIYCDIINDEDLEKFEINFKAKKYNL